MSETSKLILSVLDDIEPLMQAAFAAVEGSPEPGSALDQVFLLDGRVVVVDLVAQGEHALALEHLLYLINEPPLHVNGDTFRRLVEAARILGLPDGSWNEIDRT
jgi:hypothetical protein